MVLPIFFCGKVITKRSILIQCPITIFAGRLFLLGQIFRRNSREIGKTSTEILFLLCFRRKRKQKEKLFSALELRFRQLYFLTYCEVIGSRACVGTLRPVLSSAWA